MTKMAQTDEIDALVLSVRDFVSHKDTPKPEPDVTLDHLILTPEQRIEEDDISQTPIIVDDQGNAAPANVLRLDTVKASDPSGLKDRIAELETAVTAQTEDWEPDEGEVFDQEAWAASAFELPADDSDETDALQDDSDDPAETNGKAPNLLSSDFTDPAMDEIDDQALRALISEIVYEELTGDLGERITRNVRKLVRREINRVLASRDMGAG